MTSPPLPATAVPVPILIEPELPLVVRPELNDNMPLPLVGPDSALRMETVPLHDDFPSPDFMRT
jgi:hypothetical protein